MPPLTYLTSPFCFTYFCPILSVVSPQPHPTIFHPGNMSPDSLTALHQNTPIKRRRGICPINEIALCATACPELARKRAVLQACLSQGQVQTCAVFSS